MRFAVKRVVASTLVVLALAAAGCATSSGGDPLAPMTPLSRYSLQVEPGLDRIALAVHDNGLSANQQQAINSLASRYQATGTGWVRVEAPSGENPASIEQAYAVRGALQAAGVPGERIQMASYLAPDDRAPVLAGFETVQARVTNCAAVARDMTGRFSNQSTSNLGCAINANMAAQIADPRDILGARPMSPADSGRAAVVFDAYRQGRPSSTPQETLVEGKISQAVD